MTLPLSGCRVLDLGDDATVLAARLLADLGADVIRIEAIDGDSVRSRLPFVGDVQGVERGLAHLLYNAGKRSLALALERPAAWEIAGMVLESSDVVIAPLEKSALATAFFDDARMRTTALRVGLIDTVFRRHAPEERATDLIGTAAGGLLYLNGFAGDPPNHATGQLAYKQVSMAAALGAVSMILEQAISGVGGRITVSMQEAVMWTTIQSANENYWFWHEAVPVRRGLENLGGQTIFEACDGRWVSFYQHPPAWSAFVAWVAELLGDRRFEGGEWNDQLYRLEHHGEVTEATVALCGLMDRDELISQGQRRAILVVPVQSVTDITHDPHLRARGFFQEVWSEPLGMSIETYRAPFISSAYTAEPRPAPGLGQHSIEVLHNVCGLGDTTITGLISDGLVGIPQGAKA